MNPNYPPDMQNPDDAGETTCACGRTIAIDTADEREGRLVCRGCAKETKAEGGEMKLTKTENTWWVEIYISGPIYEIERVCRSECLCEGLCVTVTPTRFIYAGGEETGAVVGLINYPRFPSLPETITERARKLASRLLEETFQHSVLLMTPTQTEWVTKRTNETITGDSCQ